MSQIILVRHGESETNAGLIPHGSVGDHKIALTQAGRLQALLAGDSLLKTKKDFLIHKGIVYRSPYRRARETCDLLLEGWGYKTRPDRDILGHRVLEDPRLREVDHGYEDVSSQEEMREEHGWFYYRFRGGESPADCYDRCCTFLESLKREVNRRSTQIHEPNVCIVTHGLTIRCFVTRFMHLSVEQFENLKNPKNCDIITIQRTEDMTEKPQFISGQWGITGLRFRNAKVSGEAIVA
jgi:broad specificity phosphatase PhoE